MRLTVKLSELATLVSHDWKLLAHLWWGFHQSRKITKSQDGSSGYPTIPERYLHWREMIACPRKKGERKGDRIHAKTGELEGISQAFTDTDWLENLRKTQVQGHPGKLPTYMSDTASLPPFLWLFQFNILLWKQTLQRAN